jgi:hypothetical protein
MDDDIPVRAARRAIDELGSNYAPLTRVQVLLAATFAANRYCASAEQQLTDDLIEEGAVQAARAELRDKRLYFGKEDRRSDTPHKLRGGVQFLPEQQQLIWAMRFQGDMMNPAIAARLGLSEEEVVALTARSFEALMGRPYLGEFD